MYKALHKWKDVDVAAEYTHFILRLRSEKKGGCIHRYINFTFNEAGGGCQNTGTLAKFGQKTGTFSYFQYILTYF